MMAFAPWVFITIEGDHTGEEQDSGKPATPDASETVATLFLFILQVPKL